MNREQRELLLTGLGLYLHIQWTTVAPSAERNTLIRVLQALKGKLLDQQEQPSIAPFKPLWLSAEEQIIVMNMLNELMRNIATLPELNTPTQHTALQALRTQIQWNGSI